jgi:predicted dehydrogenase
MLTMAEGGIPVVCNLSFATKLENERFPETFAFIEGDRGSIELGPDCMLRVTTGEGTHVRRVAPDYYPWADPRYAVAQSSMVECNRNMLAALQTGGLPSTPAADNIRTLRLVFAAYESAGQNRLIPIEPEYNSQS